MDFFQTNNLATDMYLQESCLWPWKQNNMYSAMVYQKHYYFWIFLHILLKGRRDKDLFSYEICLVFLPKIIFLLIAEAKFFCSETLRKCQNPFFEFSHPLPESNLSWMSTLRNPTHILVINLSQVIFWWREP